MSGSGPTFCSCLSCLPKCCIDRSAILELLTDPQGKRLVWPQRYLEASHEVFGVTLVFTWVLTFIFFPDQILQHPAKPIIGSFNPCFGWDYAPASYIAVIFCSTNVYLTWRYSFLEQTRTLLANPGASLTCSQKFANWASILLAISSQIWLLLWLIGPNGPLQPVDNPRDSDGPNMANWTLHTGIFTFYALCSYLAALGNYLEVANGPYSERIGCKNTAFIVIYGLSLGFLLVVYFWNLGAYEYNKPPAVLPYITQASDFIWMFCVSSITSFLPQEPPLKITTELVTDEEAQSLMNME